MTTPVWISLGSNLGDRRAILDDAMISLGQSPEIAVRSVSSYHETKPIGGPPGQGPFLNAAAYLETTLEPFQLLAVLQEIENQAGRVRVVRWGERTLDLDILIYGTKFLDTKELKLPHPRLALRRFVLEPMAEIAAEVVEPMTKRSMTDLLMNLDRKPRYLAIHGKYGSRKSTVFSRLVDELPGFGIAEEDLESSTTPEDELKLRDLRVFEQKAIVLRASQWAYETLRVPWVLSNYFLGYDLRRAFPLDYWKRESAVDPRNSENTYHKRLDRLRQLGMAALSPTFMLVLPSRDPIQRQPGILPFPQLWPDSHDPEAIIAEVIATCRGIEAI